MMTLMKPIHVPIALVLALLCAVAFANEGHDHPAPPKVADRTIVITMSDDMRFTPARIEAKQGEILDLQLRNTGKLPHEFVLGTKKELEEHARAMRQGGHAHGGATAVTVEPGATGVLRRKFDRPGTFDFACLVPGHFEAGMKGSFVIEPRR
jgi:uncharacterized cupredoxin-like copper-binding protein